MTNSFMHSDRLAQLREKPNVRKSLVTSVKARMQYYHSSVPLSGLVPQILIDILAKMKIFVFPYHLVAEGMTTAESRSVARKFADCEFGALGPQDMPAIASIPGRGFSLAQLLSRLQEGQLCFGAKYHGEIVAFTWLNLTEGTIRSHHLFPLKAHEAFLFDAYTLERFRGMGIAPGLRYHCYKELAKLGRDQCYSVTAMWDPSAAKFKEKLGARVLELGVFVNLFRQWPFHLRLRDYTRDRR